MKQIILVLFLLVAVTSCGSHRPTASTSSPVIAKDRSDEVYRLIVGTPSWTLIQTAYPNQLQDRREILRKLKEIDQFDTASIRRAFERMELDPDVYDHQFETMYLINRYIFKVPEWAQRDDMFVVEVAGRHRKGKLVNASYPLSIDSQKQLILTGQCPRERYGPPYPALYDFDFLNNKFGRRHNR
jgi:hypothetical protein